MAIEIFGYDIQQQLPLIGISLWNLILFVIVLVVGILAVKLASRGLKKAMLHAKLTKIIAEFLTRVFRIILYVFVVAIALGFLGVDVGAGLISLSVVFGFVLGFALGDTLSNVAAGFMIAVTKPFRADHYVELNGESGKVQHVGIVTTELNTLDNKHLVIPNKAVWNSNIINYSHNPIRRVDLVTGVGYDDDLDLAIKTSMKTLRADPRVLPDPEPQVAVNEMADSSVNLVVRPWVKTEDYWGLYFDLKKALKEAYDNAGLNIPYPQSDIHIVEDTTK